MYRLVEFIRRSYVTLLFVVLEIVSISIYMRSTPYTRARMLARAESVTGGLSSVYGGVTSFFSLAGENRRLTERIAVLEERLSQIEPLTVAAADTVALPYSYVPARVVSNSVSRTHNYLTLNKGLRDGVRPNMAVVTPCGDVVGYVLECSERYCAAISILNTSFRTSGRVGAEGYEGSIGWSGANMYEVTMSEISKYATLTAGDEVVTTGFSHYFAPGMRIGRVESFWLNETHTAYTAVVRLSADMSRLQNVLLVWFRDRDEITQLENSVKQN